MSKLKSTSKVDVTTMLILSEEEVLALEALAGYGADAFLKFFYEKLGKHYLQPHEKGLRSLFETIQKELPAHVRKIKVARNLLT